MTKTICLLVAIFSFALPIALSIWWNIKRHDGIWPYIAGGLCFILFAILLEGTLNYFVASYISDKPALFALYGGFAAGIFEETARLFAFKVLLKKRNDAEVSVAYGIGHGGTELSLIMGVTYLFYFLALNGFDFWGIEVTDILIAEAARQIQPSVIPLAILERLSAITIHIALSILVFIGARKKIGWYFLAIILHAAIDIIAVFYQHGSVSLWLVEIIFLTFAVLVMLLAVRQYKSYTLPIQKPDPEKITGN